MIEMDSYKLDFTNIGKTKIMLKELKTLKIIYFVTLLLLNFIFITKRFLIFIIYKVNT